MVRESAGLALRALIVVGVLVGNGSCNRFQEAWVMNCDHTVPFSLNAHVHACACA